MRKKKLNGVKYDRKYYFILFFKLNKYIQCTLMQGIKSLQVIILNNHDFSINHNYYVYIYTCVMWTSRYAEVQKSIMSQVHI